MSKKAKLDDIIRFCETRFNRGSAVNWKHGDFSDLNREILRDTDVNISPNTLKRIFGKISVDDDYLPQQATIEALKKYGGYVPSENSQLSLANETETTYKPGLFKKNKLLLAVSLITIVVAMLLILKTFKSEDNLSGSITQSSIEGLVPATAFFDLKLPVTNDSLFIDFGDKSPLTNILTGQTKVAHNYLFPGVFHVKLQTKQNTIAITTVYVQSDKWIGLGFHRQRDIPDRYYQFPAVKTGQDSLFHIDNSQLQSMGLDTASSIFTRLCNFTPTGYASDDFIFESTFKNDLHEKGIYCNSTQFQIAGINSMIRFRLASKGCSFRVLNVLSEQVFDGSKTNLSQFVIDLEKWNTVRLINKNKQVSLFVNDKLLFEGAYQNSLGEIKGIFLEFEGNGFVKSCDLKTPDGKILYHF